MRKYFVVMLMSLFVTKCSPFSTDTFSSEELISSKGEKIYINSLNWGITGDYQLSIISSDKERLKEREDTIGVVQGLDPFIYAFRNDTLTLYFNQSIKYRVKEEFKTIDIRYIRLDNSTYSNYYNMGFQNIKFHHVPNSLK